MIAVAVNLGYTLTDCMIIIGSVTLAILSTTGLVTVLCGRRKAKDSPHSRAVNQLLNSWGAADRMRGKLNPRRVLTRI